MITEKFLNFLFGMVETMFNLIPTPSDDITTALTEVFSFLEGLVQAAAFFLPLGTIFTILTLVLVISNFQIIMYFVNWVIRRIADLIP